MSTLTLLVKFFFYLPGHLIGAARHGRIWHADYWAFMVALFWAILMGRLE